ncbi:MAG: DUF4476 domain-containing protein, partial [Bacteroidetes bacterium]|nr:DUF4476 domain-containing protein [Bacteroidota bacterium]
LRLCALICLWTLPGMPVLVGQTTPCRTAITPAMLEVYLQSMDTLALESERIDQALLLLKEECVYAEQGVAILKKLALGSSRLTVAKALWHRTLDGHNYYLVPLTLSSESQRQALAAYTDSHPAVADSAAIPAADSLPQAIDTLPATNTPKVLRSEVKGYYGPLGCQYIMGDAAMAQAKAAIRSKNFPDQRKATGQEIIGQYCLTTAQLIQLIELYDFESDRLEMARFAFRHTHDQHNSYLLISLFNHERNAEQYIQWLSEQPHGQLGVVTRPAPPGGLPAENLCGSPSVADADVQSLITSLSALSFADGKEKVLRYWLQGRCLSTQQVISILQVFGSDADRLRMAKALFPYTTDNSQYFMVNDVFAEDNARLELNAFITDKH